MKSLVIAVLLAVAFTCVSTVPVYELEDLYDKIDEEKTLETAERILARIDEKSLDELIDVLKKASKIKHNEEVGAVKTKIIHLCMEDPTAHYCNQVIQECIDHHPDDPDCHALESKLVKECLNDPTHSYCSKVKEYCRLHKQKDSNCRKLIKTAEDDEKSKYHYY